MKARRGWSVCGPGLFLALCALPAGTQATDSTDEWRIRGWAFNGGESRTAMRAEMEREGVHWMRRVAVLDALTRGLGAGTFGVGDGERALVARGQSDSHPAVVAQALRAVAAAPDDLSVPDELVGHLSNHALPVVRLALAHALAADAAHGPTLAALARDVDPRVASAARARLVALGAGARTQVLALMEELAMGAGRDDWLALLRVVLRAPADHALLRGLRRIAAGSGEHAPTDRALVEAIATGLGYGGGAEGARLLVAGWRGDGPRRELLLEGASAGDPSLGHLLVTFLRDLADPGHGTDELRFDLVHTAQRCLGPTGAGRIPPHGTDGIDPASPLAMVWLEGLGSWLEAWNLDASSPWLATDLPPAVRAASAEALGAIAGRTAEPGTMAALLSTLEDGDSAVVEVGFRALWDSGQGARHQDRLQRAWSGFPRGKAVELLAHIPRGNPLPAFRDDLLRLGGTGAAGGAARVAAVELLAASSGDREVARTLAGWLAAEVKAHVEGEAMGARDRELSIKGIARALVRVDPGGSVPALDGALGHLLGISVECTKTLAWALGRTPAGRAQLASLLSAEAPRSDSRTRIEAAIALAPHPAEGRASSALEALLGDWDRAAWDLRVRMVPAIGDSLEGRAFEFLRALVMDGTAGFEERRAAVVALDRSGVAVPLLAELARGAPGLELKRVVIEVLGQRRSTEAKTVLVDLLAPRLDDTLVAEEEEVLFGDLLAALGNDVRLGDPLEIPWLARPLAAAAATLELRRRGEGMPDAGFTRRGELAFSRGLAGAGRLLDALAMEAGDADGSLSWLALDARLLLAMAEGSRSSGGDAGASLHLARAGLIALGGEGGTLPVVGLRARLSLASMLEGSPAADRVLDALIRDHRAGLIPDGNWSSLLARGVLPGEGSEGGRSGTKTDHFTSPDRP